MSSWFAALALCLYLQGQTVMINALTVGVSTSPPPPANLELLLERLTCIVAIQSQNICALRPGPQ